MAEEVTKVSLDLGKSDAKEFIVGQIATASEHITTAQSLIAGINTSISGRMSSDLDTDADFDGIEFDVADPTFDKKNVTSIEAPTSPDLSGVLGSDVDIVFNDPSDGEQISVTLPNSPTLTNVSAIATGTAPTLSVTDPDTGFNYSPSGYVSGLIEFTQQKIREAFAAEDELTQISAESNVSLDGNTSQVVSVDQDIEQAIYDRAVSRLLDEESKAVSNAETAIQARGFSLPPGALNNQLAMISKAALQSREELNNDIVKTRIELEQKRTEFELQRAIIMTDAQYKHDSILAQLHNVNVEYVKARAQNRGIYIDAAAKLEGILAEIYKTEETLKLNTESQSIQSTIDVYNAKVSGFKSLMEAYKVESDVSIASTNAELDMNKSLIDIYSAEIGAARVELDTKKATLEGKQINAEIEKISVAAQVEKAKAENDRVNTLANVYSTSVQAFAAKVNAVKAVEMFDLERYRTEAGGKAIEIQANISKATTEIDAALKRYAVDMEMLKQQSTLAGNIVSSALNSVNTSASFGYAGHNGNSANYGQNKSVSHSYQYSGEIGDVA